jgi:O-antigen ligase
MENPHSSTVRAWIRGGLYLLLLTPLLASSSFLFPQLTPKALVFQAIVEVLAALVLAARILEGDFRAHRFRPGFTVGSALLVFVAVALVSALAGVDPSRSLFGFVDRQDGLVLWLHFVAWFAVARWFFAGRGAGAAADYARASFWVALAVSATALVDWGAPRLGSEAPFIFQSITQGRAAGIFGNPVALGPYLSFHFFFGLYYGWGLWQKQRPAALAGVAAAEALFLLALLLGQTRGVLLGLAAGIGLLLVILAAVPATPTGLRRAAAGLVLAGVLGTAALVFVPPGLRSRIGVDRVLRMSATESAEMRRMTWRSALRGFPDHPALGWGHDAVYYALNRYYDPQHVQFAPDFKESRATWYDKSHSAYVDLLVEKGIAGLLAFALLAAAVGRALLRRAVRALARCLAAGLFAYAASNTVAFDTFGSHFGLFLFLILAGTAGEQASEAAGAPVRAPAASRGAAARGGQRAAKSRAGAAAPLRGWQLGALATVLVALSAALYGNLEIGLANAATLEAQRAFVADAPHGIVAYRAAFDHPSPYNAREKLDCASRIASVAVARLLGGERDAAIAYALELARAAASAHPRDAVVHMVLNDFYNTLGAYQLWNGPALELAEAAGRRALELSPKRQEAMIPLGRTYIFKKEPERAVALNREMVESYTGFPLAHWLLGLSLAEAGHVDEAKREIRLAFALGYKFQNPSEEQFVRGLLSHEEYVDLLRGLPPPPKG